jgi:hypothetical protein
MPSSLGSAREGSSRLRQAPEEVTIDDWPLRDRPLGASIALTLAAGLTWLAVWATGVTAVGAAIGVALSLTLWRSWLPVRYQVGSGGIVQTVLGWRRRIPWTAIRRYELRGDGVLLLADAFRAGMSPLRGLYMHCGNNREAVIAQLEYHLIGQ